ncbi:hypothetical protein ILUMI_03611 [Ignelater luminosus]|uniref:Peptidase aspartic putative domain-containing protein n=1 Tax=Ignelater luminosus TaxID=2038154 RepID=A0A8K0GI56_IGNLU|nr:hypothetical protein ILUMI_03611 [Ignelater luminosus]
MLKSRAKFIDSYLSDFMTSNMQLLNSLKDADLTEEDTFWKQADETFFFVTSVVDELFPPAAPSTPTVKPTNNSSHNLKLPKIHIPRFEEDFKTWDTLAVPEIINNTSAAMNSATLSSHTVLTSTSLSQITTLLSTVLVELIDAWGNPIKVQALLDSASQVSFVTEKYARRLGIPRFKSCIPIQVDSTADVEIAKTVVNATTILKGGCKLHPLFRRRDKKKETDLATSFQRSKALQDIHIIVEPLTPKSDGIAFNETTNEAER